MREQYGFLRESMGASTASSFLWDACERAELFIPSRYTTHLWDQYADRFVSNVMEDIMLPTGMSPSLVQARLRAALKEWTDKQSFLKEIQRVEARDPDQVRKLFDRARAMNAEKLPKFAQFFRGEEYPSILWMELDRAISTYMDGLAFVGKRMEIWKQRRPRRESEVFSRNVLTKLMVQPIQGVLESFLTCLMEFYKLFITIDAWNSDSIGEILEEKRIRVELVPEEFFEERIFKLQESVTMVRQHLGRFDSLIKHQVDPTIERSLHDIIYAMTSDLHDGEEQ